MRRVFCILTSVFNCVFWSRIGLVTYIEDKEFGSSARLLHNCSFPKLLSVKRKTLFYTFEVLGHLKVCLYIFVWVNHRWYKIKKGMQWKVNFRPPLILPATCCLKTKTSFLCKRTFLKMTKHIKLTSNLIFHFLWWCVYIALFVTKLTCECMAQQRTRFCFVLYFASERHWWSHSGNIPLQFNLIITTVMIDMNLFNCGPSVQGRDPSSTPAINHTLHCRSFSPWDGKKNY